jgi:hypothetical protein
MYELRSTGATFGCHSEEPFDRLRVNSTTKNLEILRPAQDDSSFLRGACPELAEGLRMTKRRFRVDTR